MENLVVGQQSRGETSNTLYPNFSNKRPGLRLENVGHVAVYNKRDVASPNPSLSLYSDYYTRQLSVCLHQVEED